MLAALIIAHVAATPITGAYDIKAATRLAFTSSRDPVAVRKAVSQVLSATAKSRREAYQRATSRLYSDIQHTMASTGTSPERLAHLMGLVQKVNDESERDPFGNLAGPLERVLLREDLADRGEYLSTLIDLGAMDEKAEPLDPLKRVAWERRRQDFAETVQTRDDLLQTKGSMECCVTVRLFDKNGKKAKGYFVWICPTDRSDNDDNFVRFAQPSTPTSKDRMKGGWVYLKIRKTSNRADPVVMQPKEHLKSSEETFEYTLERG
jgi:hypothetical protein